MQAVILGALGTAQAPNPAANLGTAILAQHPGGVKLQTVDGQPLHGLVHGQFLADMSPFLGAIATFMGAVVTAALAPDPVSAVEAIGAAASAFLADPAVTAFLSGVTASSAGSPTTGLGTAPYATTLHKATP